MCIQLIAEVFTAVGTIGAAVFSCIALRQTNKIRNENEETERIKNTLKAINKLQTQVFDNLMFVTEKQAENAAKQVRGQLYKELSAMAARLEHFSIGVYNNVYDKNTARALMGNHFYYQYKKLQPVIEKQRAKHNNENAFDNFIKLANEFHKKEEV